jgi:hypothetical protein
VNTVAVSATVTEYTVQLRLKNNGPATTATQIVATALSPDVVLQDDEVSIGGLAPPFAGAEVVATVSHANAASEAAAWGGRSLSNSRRLRRRAPTARTRRQVHVHARGRELAEDSNL